MPHQCRPAIAARRRDGAQAQNPGLSVPTSPSRVRVPSGKISTELAALQALERFFQSAQTQAFAVQGNRIERINEPAKWSESEQRVAGQIVQPPVGRQTDQHRVEMALMIRQHEAATVARNEFPSAAANSEHENSRQPANHPQRVVPQPLRERALCHAVMPRMRRGGPSPGKAADDLVPCRRLAAFPGLSARMRAVFSRYNGFIRPRTSDSKRSTTSDGDKPSVENITASAAAAKGPTRRPASRASRSFCRARISSKGTDSPRAASSCSAAAGPFLGACRQKDFTLGVRKYDRPLIASFGDDVVVTGRAALQFDKHLAHARIVGGVVRYARDGRSANRIANVDAVQQHLRAAKFDRQSPGQFHQCLRIGPIQSVLRGGQRDCTIHGPRVQKAKPQAAGQGPSRRALAGAGRSV